MQTIRLFTGTYADRTIFEDIYEDLMLDFEGITTGKWVEPENLHFTYHFIGDYATVKLAELKSCLKDICKIYNHSLILKGLTAFPDLRNPRVLNVKVIDENGILKKIHKDMENILIPFGYKPENRKYIPHVTLQRIKSFDKEEFKSIINDYADLEFGEMNEFSVNLIESQLTAAGPVYKVIM